MRYGSFIFLAACLFLSGCSSLEDNRGSTLTTSADQQITGDMVVGKWDLDGERTNTANGKGGVGAIPDDIFKDVFGTGWEFQGGGLLLTDRTVGTKDGTWSIEGKNTLLIKEGAGAPEQRFEITFRDGFMYLKDGSGRYSVMEKEKFFGF